MNNEIKADVPQLSIPQRMKAFNDESATEFWQTSRNIDELVCERALKFDQIIIELWQAADWPESAIDKIGLYAVGGYGRGELHPHSDIDLLILVIGQPENHTQQIETFIQSLWDLKVNIGHSVRNLEELYEESKADISVATSILERRQLVGPASLDRSIGDLFASDEIWPNAKFFKAKRDEQEKRYDRHADTEYNLEPNIKSSPGGLRDIQTINWITRRFFGSALPTDLVSRNVLTEKESQALQNGRRFLWQVRFGLHLLSGRGEDRLLFDYQRELAKKFGYTNSSGQLAVEQFMHHYYRVVLEIREINDLLLQHFDEAILRAHYAPKIEPINDYFQIRDDYIQVTDNTVFESRPAALLEMFVIMANRQDIAGVRASTIRLVKNSLHLIDDSFRENPEANGYFMQLLRAPYSLVAQLTRMRRYGILGKYIKEFGKIVGQMQHDLFHIYTVDAHTVMVIRNMQLFKKTSSQDKFPVAHHCINNIEKIELLYLAGLFHDIGKGRGGDHSELGAVDAVAFCKRHALSAEDTDLVEWLIKSHLLMSAVAQRQDIYDPDVIQKFARLVETEARLDYLYTLTVADINSTNPTLWNNWRATLMRSLYVETRKTLRRNPEDFIDRSTYINGIISVTLERLKERGISIQRARAIWERPEPEFFLQHSPVQIAAMTEAIENRSQAQIDNNVPVVLIRDFADRGSEEGATEIFLYAKNQPHLFTLAVMAMDNLELSVLAAHLHTSPNDMSFSSYVVLDESGKPMGEKSPKRDQLRELLTRYIATPAPDPTIFEGRSKRLVPRRLKQFKIPTMASIDCNESQNYSVLSVTTSDRPGLLAHIGTIFLDLGISVRSAKITTLGEKVEDVFYITDMDNKPIIDDKSAHSLTSTICTQLDEEP